MGSLSILAGVILTAQAPSLNKAISLFNNLDDAAASKELHALLLKPDLAETVAARAHIYLGLIALNAIHSKEAREQFKQALTLDAMLDLPRRASPKAKLAFAEARHELQVEMAKPVERAPRPGPRTNPTPAAAPAAAPTPEPFANLEISPSWSTNAEPAPAPEAAPAAPPPEVAPAPPPPQSPPQAPPPAPPRATRQMVLIPPPAPPPADVPIVEEHAKEEPPPPKNHAAAITLGIIGLAAGGVAIAGAVEVQRYNSTLADARKNPGKYTGSSIAAKENTAEIWQISAITLTVVAGLGLGGAVLAW